MTDEVESRRTTDSFRDRFRTTPTSSLDMLTYLEAEEHETGMPSDLLGYRLNGLPLEPRADAVATRTMSHLKRLHNRLFRRVTKLSRRDDYKSMDRIEIRNDGGVSVLAVHLELGLVYAVGSQGSVHSLLYTFHRPLPLLDIADAVGGNDVEVPPPVGGVDSINSTENSSLFRTFNTVNVGPVFDSERPSFELDSKQPAFEKQSDFEEKLADRQVEGGEASEWVVMKRFKMFLDKLSLIYKQVWIGMSINPLPLQTGNAGIDETDGVNQLCDHVGHHVTLTCLGVESSNYEFSGMVCDQHGEITHVDCEMHYCPAQFKILMDDSNATSADHIVSILSLGMGPNQNFFVALFTDNTWGTRFAVQQANGSGKKFQVPTASKFHFRMTKGNNGYRFQAVASDQRYLAFAADGKQEIITNHDINISPSDLKSQFVFTPILG